MKNQCYIYLHGFASSPQGYKAVYLRQCFQDVETQLISPDLNQGDFFHLTLTRQLNLLEAEYLSGSHLSQLHQQPVRDISNVTGITLIGSSFGGLTAAILAERNLCVNRLVLLAPAFQFHLHLFQLLGAAKMRQWQADGLLHFPHYGANCDLPLSYQFWTDLVQYESQVFSRSIPTLILHGIHDEVIPIQSSGEFASQRPWVELRELDSDHGLGNVVADIWQAIQGFCQI